MSDHLYPKDAKALASDPTALTDEKLAECWKSIAGQISYLHADDYGGDWKLVPLWRPALDAFDAEHDWRGLPRPSRAGFLL
ncbi:hypothetical protein [Sphingomonas sp. HMP6]|uniref:hypothetical protein n=1 Tax=Sphingomonas sp. HMP6 TaxID=1517551 RepID=UPI001596489D|nr:hypothetical protein [Sphingomonas sp. HMP6]BCA57723.1 hypothetical protein HMP06_0492 [Sphingomonas sp. HMP6]